MRLLETQTISTFKNTSHKQVKFMTPIIRTASSKYPIKFPDDSELPQCFPIRKSNNSQSIFTFFLWFFFHGFQPDLSHTFIPVCFSRFTPQCFQLSLLIVRKASSDLVFVSFWWHVPRHIRAAIAPVNNSSASPGGRRVRTLSPHSNQTQNEAVSYKT